MANDMIKPFSQDTAPQGSPAPLKNAWHARRARRERKGEEQCLDTQEDDEDAERRRHKRNTTSTQSFLSDASLTQHRPSPPALLGRLIFDTWARRWRVEDPASAPALEQASTVSAFCLSRPVRSVEAHVDLAQAVLQERVLGPVLFGNDQGSGGGDWCGGGRRLAATVL